MVYSNMMLCFFAGVSQPVHILPKLNLFLICEFHEHLSRVHYTNKEAQWNYTNLLKTFNETLNFGIPANFTKFF